MWPFGPQATTSMIVNVPRSLLRSKPKRRKQGRVRIFWYTIHD